jgi:L,D-transpeptidase YcbB
MRVRAVVGLTSTLAILAVGGLSNHVFAEPSDGVNDTPAIVARIELDQSPAAIVPDTVPTGMTTDPLVDPAATTPADDVQPQSTSAQSATILVDPVVADVRQRVLKLAASQIAKDDRQALVKAYNVDGVKPLWVSEKGLSERGLLLHKELKNADDWGLKGGDFDIAFEVSANAGTDELAMAELKLSSALLKYARHARGGRVDPTQLSSYLDRRAQLIQPKRVLDEIAANPTPDAYLRSLHPQHPQFEKLRQAYLALRKGEQPIGEAYTPPDDDARPVRKGKPEAKSAVGSVRKLIANMEMWRWMPVNLGATHLMVNVPEFQFRLVRDGATIHSERVIVGKLDTQTPVFSDMMETIVFKPSWNVPDSIKVKELLPALSRNPQALARQGLRVAYNGREIDPAMIDWSTTDIRALHVFQPPSDANALGIVKFLFPNKHAVYLHDTPSKPLFNSARRTFSHGCIRVRNPVRLAEVLMEADRGWSASQVRTQLDSGAPENTHTTLAKKFPVHIAYFTAFANDAGEVQYFNDVYDYEANIHLGLEGRTHLIARKKEDVAPPSRGGAPFGRMVETRSSSAPANREWMNKIFNNN